jgi:hypothetical protein
VRDVFEYVGARGFGRVRAGRFCFRPARDLRGLGGKTFLSSRLFRVPRPQSVFLLTSRRPLVKMNLFR